MENWSQKQFGLFVLDERERRLRRDGETVSLTPKAFDLLTVFVGQPGRLLTKDELLKAVWPDTFVEESNLAYHVFLVRKALGQSSGNVTYIETVPKQGYRFTVPVNPVARTEAPAAPVAANQGPPDRASRAPGSIAEPARVGQRTRSQPSRLGIAGIVLAAAIVLYVSAWTRRGEPEAQPLRAIPVTSMIGALRAPTLSPDGKFVAFAWTGENRDNPDIYIQQIGTGGPQPVTTDPGNDFSPAWSPDGNWIAFLRRRPTGDPSEVWVTAPLGGSERKVAALTPNLAAYAPPSIAWCPDSRCLLATDSEGPGTPDGVFVIALETGEKRQLTRPAGLAGDVDPVVSPDGRSLVFRRNTTPFTGMIYRLPLSDGVVPTGEPVRLTSQLIGGAKATWTLDSREIVFGSGGALWRLNVLEGGTPARLPFVGENGATPVVARTSDGRQRLVYVRGHTDTNIWRLELAAAGARPLSAPTKAIATTRGEYIPSLSPDGRRLAFVSDRSGEPHIWVADLDGARALQLTPATFAVNPGYPRWNHNGTAVAFHGAAAGRPDVVVVPANGGHTTVFTKGSPNGGFPSFSRDGRWIYFCVVGDDKEPRVWKMPLGGGAAVPVTPNRGRLAIESWDGRDLYYVSAVERTSSVWRMPVAGGEPVKVLDGVLSGSFDVVDGGIYFIELVSGNRGNFWTDRPGETRLRYYDFGSRQLSTVAEDLGWAGFGVVASRDGRSVFFGRIDSSATELMVVEDFR